MENNIERDMKNKVIINQLKDFLDELKRRYIRGESVNVLGAIRLIKKDILDMDCSITDQDIKDAINKLPSIDQGEIEALETIYRITIVVDNYKKNFDKPLGKVVEDIRDILNKLEV